MARFSDTLIDKIKTEVDLLRLVADQGYEIKNHGVKDKAIRCPFHEDDTASIKALKAIHTRTHPAKLKACEADTLLAALEQEAQEELGGAYD